MMKATKTGVLMVIAISTLATAQNTEQASKPQMQRVAKMLVGTWKVVEDFAPGGTLPKGGKGTGHSVIRPGPGGFSVIEDFVSSVPNLPDYHGHAVYWWDKTAQGLKTVGCDDFSEEVCSIADGLGRWEGNDVCDESYNPEGRQSRTGQNRLGRKGRPFVHRDYVRS